MLPPSTPCPACLAGQRCMDASCCCPRCISVQDPGGTHRMSSAPFRQGSEGGQPPSPPHHIDRARIYAPREPMSVQRQATWPERTGGSAYGAPLPQHGDGVSHATYPSNQPIPPSPTSSVSIPPNTSFSVRRHLDDWPEVFASLMSDPAWGGADEAPLVQAPPEAKPDHLHWPHAQQQQQQQQQQQRRQQQQQQQQQPPSMYTEPLPMVDAQPSQPFQLQQLHGPGGLPPRIARQHSAPASLVPPTIQFQYDIVKAPKAFGREDAPDELGGGKDAALVLDVLEEVLIRPPSTQLDVMRARAIILAWHWTTLLYRSSDQPSSGGDTTRSVLSRFSHALSLPLSLCLPPVLSAAGAPGSHALNEWRAEEVHVDNFLRPLSCLGPDKATCVLVLSLPTGHMSVRTNDRFSSVFMTKDTLEEAVIHKGILPHMLWARLIGKDSQRAYWAMVLASVLSAGTQGAEMGGAAVTELGIQSHEPLIVRDRFGVWSQAVARFGVHASSPSGLHWCAFLVLDTVKGSHASSKQDGYRGGAADAGRQMDV